MGNYNVGYHVPKCGRDLNGIATLTKDPIAKDNIRRIQGTTSLPRKYGPRGWYKPKLY